MALDPQAEGLLQMMAAMEVPPFEQMTVEQARAMAGAMAMGEPPAIARVDDATVPGPAGPIPVRVYRPVDRDGLPVIVYLHGGGWVIGSIDSYDSTCRELANASACAVASVEYRLAPEHPYPAAFDDAYAATAWIAANGDVLGVDGSRLAVVGDSAGGNLAAAVSIHARDIGEPSIAFQGLVYPAVDHDFDRPSMVENAEGYLLTTAAMRWFWDHYLGRDATQADWRAWPIRAGDLGGIPPALVFTAEYDPLRDEGEAYGEAMRAAGVDVTVKRFDGMIHGFFQMTAMLDQAKVAMRELASAAGRRLGADAPSATLG